MIRAVDNKPLELSDDEYNYYNQIVDAFGVNVFQNTFTVNEDEGAIGYGYITLVTPPMDKNLPIGVVYFLMNCMLNQRIREFEKTMRDFKAKEV